MEKDDEEQDGLMMVVVMMMMMMTERSEVRPGRSEVRPASGTEIWNEVKVESGFSQLPQRV